MSTPDLETLPGVKILECTEAAPGVALDEANIRMVTGGDPVTIQLLSSGCYAPISRQEGCGKFSDLFFGEASREPCAVDVQRQSSFEMGSALSDLKADAVDGMADVASIGLMNIGHGGQEFGCQFDGGDSADEVAFGVIGRENTDLSVMPDNARNPVVGEGGDHKNVFRASRGASTITEGGASDSPVLNNRRRAPGGDR